MAYRRYTALTAARSIAIGGQPKWNDIEETTPAELLSVMQRMCLKDPNERPVSQFIIATSKKVLYEDLETHILLRSIRSVLKCMWNHE
jgi:hypothetical protein